MGRRSWALVEMKRQTKTFKSTVRDVAVGIYLAIVDEEIDWEIAILVFGVIGSVLAGVGLGVWFFNILSGLVGD